MKNNSLILLTILTSLLLFKSAKSQDCDPQQIILSLGEKFSGNSVSDKLFTISFITLDTCKETPQLILENSEKKQIVIEQPQVVTPYNFKDEKLKIDYNRKSYFFYVSIDQVNALNSKKLVYSVKIGDNTSGPFERKILNNSPELPVKLFWTADMDLTDNSTYTRKKIDNIDWSGINGYIHTGDYAYEISDDNGLKGDRFFEEMSKTFKKVPFIGIAGNHENYDNGKLFNYRLRMPTGDDNYQKYYNDYFTIIIKNTQFFFVNYDNFLVKNPYTWQDYLKMVEVDLKKSQANKDIKWRVVMTHRPIFCSDAANHDCFTIFFYLRPFEILYRKYKVNFHLASHEHAYERIAFMEDFVPFEVKEYNDENKHVVEDNGKMFHIVNGCGGTEEFFPLNITDFRINAKLVSGTQCYSYITFNDESFKIEIFDSKKDEILDSFELVKTLKIINRMTLFTWIAIIVMAIVMLGFLFYVVSRITKDKGEHSDGSYTKVDSEKNELTSFD